MKKVKDVHVLLVYFNFQKPGESGHIGLGVNALHSLKALRREGIPCVVSPAIEWAPNQWKADPDSIENNVNIGIKLIKDKKSGLRGWEALAKFQQEAMKVWVKFLVQ